jgi:magnesium-transporting ATPase (P-type)
LSGTRAIPTFAAPDRLTNKPMNGQTNKQTNQSTKISNEMKKLWRWSGTYLTATGIIHTAFALFAFRNIYWEMLREGLVNSAGDAERAAAFWFLVCGVLLLFLGPVLQRHIRESGRPAPMWIGVALLLFSAIGCAVEPVSGFWLFVPQAVVIIAANCKPAQREKR